MDKNVISEISISETGIDYHGLLQWDDLLDVDLPYSIRVSL